MKYLEQDIDVHIFELHFHEFKLHVIAFLFSFFYLFIVCYYFSDQLIYLFAKILIESNMLQYLIFTSITEILITNLFISFVVSFYISIQVIFIYIFLFFSNGLYRHENYIFLKTYLMFLIFNIVVLLIILVKIIPNIWYGLLNMSFAHQELFHIFFEPKLNNYFNFIFYSFFFIYMIFFYFFILFFFFCRKILKVKLIMYFRKFFHFQFIILSTVISPPDIFYQLTMFLFLIILFEIYIYLYLIISKYLNKK